jgi:hypothetical protein
METVIQRIGASRIIWFLTTVVLGAAPIVVSILSNVNHTGIELTKIEDYIYWGMAMSVANVTLVCGKKWDAARVILVILSMIAVFFLSVCLGIAQANEPSALHIAFKIFTYSTVIATIWLSHQANNYAFQAFR